MKCKLLFILVIMLIIPMVMATTLGTFKRGENIILVQNCENCTTNNISRILFPNSTIALANQTMARDDTYYSFIFTNTTTNGVYIVNGVGDLNGIRTSWVYDFEITGTGFEFTQARSIFYIALLGLLIFLFVLVVVIIPKLPSGNESDEYGMLIGINHLKYFRPVFYVISWTLLLGIVFTSSNVALAYMGSEMFGQLLFTIYRIMFLMTIPGLFIYFIFILVSIFKDVEMKKLLERGADIQTP